LNRSSKDLLKFIKQNKIYIILNEMRNSYNFASNYSPTAAGPFSNNRSQGRNNVASISNMPSNVLPTVP